MLEVFEMLLQFLVLLPCLQYLNFVALSLIAFMLLDKCTL